MNTIYAQESGDVIGYFFGHEAHDADFIRMWDVTTDYVSDWVFNNLKTEVGTQVNLGSVNKGDKLVFELWNRLQNTPQPGAGYIYYSQPNLNKDQLNHFYTAQWTGGTVDGAFIPAGTFMGGEDLPNPYADWDYNDNEFVWNINPSDAPVSQPGQDNAATPEPVSLQLMFLGAVTALPALRRRLSA